MSTTYKINASPKYKDPTVDCSVKSSSTPSESILICQVKETSDSVALTALVNAHTGIYVDVISRYAHVYPHVIKKDDLVEDRLYNLYRFIVDYDPTRGAKLSTYICDRTNYMCKTLLKQDRVNPITAGTYGPGGALSLGTMGDTYTTNSGTNITLIDECPDAKVVDTANKDLQIEDIMKTITTSCSDKRFLKILQYRHFNTPETCLSWREIGKRMKLSHERVRVIYNENIDIIKQYLKKV